MAGVAASLTTVGLEEAIQRAARLHGAKLGEFADNAGAILESSTRERFETKQAPDGSEWAAWSEAYDETRNHGQHSLLVSENELLESVASYSSASEVEVGSGMIYAAHHHFGGEEIGTGVPARPFLGVSNQDEGDLKDLAEDWFGRLVQ